jgi:hypothetical protein
MTEATKASKMAMTMIKKSAMYEYRDVSSSVMERIVELKTGKPATAPGGTLAVRNVKYSTRDFPGTIMREKQQRTPAV